MEVWTGETSRRHRLGETEACRGERRPYKRRFSRGTWSHSSATSMARCHAKADLVFPPSIPTPCSLQLWLHVPLLKRLLYGRLSPLQASVSPSLCLLDVSPVQTSICADHCLSKSVPPRCLTCPNLHLCRSLSLQVSVS